MLSKMISKGCRGVLSQSAAVRTLFTFSRQQHLIRASQPMMMRMQQQMRFSSEKQEEVVIEAEGE